MSLSYSAVNFSIDLVEHVEKLLRFLKKVDDLRYLYDSRIIKEAARRYERLWLPLVVKYTGTIAAPIDIYYVWYIHMLSPASYRYDLSTKFKKVLDHTFLDDKTYESALKDIRKMWYLKYENEPFHFTNLNVKNVKYKTKLSYDIVAAACRQAPFYYQVSLPHYQSKHFLSKCVDRYKMFLSLKRKFPSRYIVPCYDIDIIWHTHRAHHLIYYNDCIKYFDSLFSQDDWVNDHHWNVKMVTVETLTSDLWRKHFHETFSNSGSMFRGFDSKKNMYDVSERFLISVVPRVLTFDFDIISESSKWANFKLCIYLSSNTGHEWIGTYDFGKKKMIESNSVVVFHTDVHTGFRLKLVRKTGIRRTRWESKMSMLEKFFHLLEIGEVINVDLDIETKTKSFNPIQIQFILKSYLYNDFDGYITLGEYLIVSFDRLDKTTLGFIPFPICEADRFNGLLATHSAMVESYGGRQAFDINIIHILALNQSIIQVFSENKMCAMAHMINREQLPNRLQVEDFIRYPTINNSDANAAMIIKDNKGDWMILVPRWLDTKLDKEKTRYNRSLYGLDIRLYHLRDHKEHIFKKIEDKKNIKFEIDNLCVNISTGTIALKSPLEYDTIPNNICLAFAVSVLFILCEPRLNSDQKPEISDLDDDAKMKHYEKLQSKSLDSTMQILGIPMPLVGGSKGIAKTKYDKCQLLLASGYLYDPYISDCCIVNVAALRSRQLEHKSNSKRLAITNTNYTDDINLEVDKANPIIDEEDPNKTSNNESDLFSCELDGINMENNILINVDENKAEETVDTVDSPPEINETVDK